ncbi:hypothetical protein [Micromonospora humida]|uniref:hypothetical protein n=1 Tax=Micromonospora humida TaxID=2809018 RepID=UPI003426AB55
MPQAFAFLFDRLSHLLDHWNDKKNQSETPEAPAALQGELGTLVVNEPIFLRHQAELQNLAGALGSYVRNPERLSTEDKALVIQLGRLRGLLEEVYGRALSFDGETDRPETGTRVEQRVDSVTGTVLGVDGVQDGPTHVVQQAKTVEAGGWLIGVRSDKRQ